MSNYVWIRNESKLFEIKDKNSLNENDVYELYNTLDNAEVNDLVNLQFVNIPTIQHVLKLRYTKNLIYTDISNTFKVTGFISFPNLIYSVLSNTGR